MRARAEGLRDFGACMSPTTAFHILQELKHYLEWTNMLAMHER